MSLACDLGFHAPDGIPRWNDGYYFAVCRRCGRDIVRTAYEKWHEPVGYRVVWSAQPPEERPDIKVVPTRAAAAILSETFGVPTREVTLRPPEPTPPDPLPAQSVPEGAPPAPAAPPPEAQAPSRPLSETPADGVPATPLGASGMATPPRRGSALPIEAVLAQLRAEAEPPSAEAAAPPEQSTGMPQRPPEPAVDAGADATPEPAAEATTKPVPEPAPEAEPPTASEAPADTSTSPAPPRRSTWDFMNDDPKDTLIIEPAASTAMPRPQHAPAPATVDAAPAAPEAQPWQVLLDRLANASLKVRGRLSPLVARLAAGTEPPPWLTIVIAFLGSFLIGLIVVLAMPGPSSSPSDAPPTSLAPAPITNAAPTAAAPAQSTIPTQAYVAATELSCRAGPSRQARRVKTLARGARLEILDRAGEWASVGHEGRQCWALARLITDLPPA